MSHLCEPTTPARPMDSARLEIRIHCARLVMARTAGPISGPIPGPITGPIPGRAPLRPRRADALPPRDPQAALRAILTQAARPAPV